MFDIDAVRLRFCAVALAGAWLALPDAMAFAQDRSLASPDRPLTQDRRMPERVPDRLSVQPADPAPADVAPASPPNAPPQVPAAQGPGFLESVGRWMDQSVSGVNRNLNDIWKGAARSGSDAARASTEATTDFTKGAVDAWRGTAGAFGRLGSGRVATGRERCGTAANGAPDCRQAAELLCRSKGMSGGNSLDLETVERCPALVLLRGNKQPGECPIEHTVTRAVCQ